MKWNGTYFGVWPWINNYPATILLFHNLGRASLPKFHRLSRALSRHVSQPAFRQGIPLLIRFPKYFLTHNSFRRWLTWSPSSELTTMPNPWPLLRMASMSEIWKGMWWVRWNPTIIPFKPLKSNILWSIMTLYLQMVDLVNFSSSWTADFLVFDSRSQNTSTPGMLGIFSPPDYFCIATGKWLSAMLGASCHEYECIGTTCSFAFSKDLRRCFIKVHMLLFQILCSFFNFGACFKKAFLLFQRNAFIHKFLDINE